MKKNLKPELVKKGVGLGKNMAQKGRKGGGKLEQKERNTSDVIQCHLLIMV